MHLKSRVAMAAQIDNIIAYRFAFPIAIRPNDKVLDVTAVVLEICDHVF